MDTLRVQNRCEVPEKTSLNLSETHVKKHQKIVTDMVNDEKLQAIDIP